MQRNTQVNNTITPPVESGMIFQQLLVVFLLLCEVNVVDGARFSTRLYFRVKRTRTDIKLRLIIDSRNGGA